MKNTSKKLSGKSRLKQKMKRRKKKSNYLYLPRRNPITGLAFFGEPLSPFGKTYPMTHREVCQSNISNLQKLYFWRKKESSFAGGG